MMENTEGLIYKCLQQEQPKESYEVDPISDPTPPPLDISYNLENVKKNIKVYDLLLRDLLNEQKQITEEKEVLKHNILLVDNEKDLCERIKAELVKEGYEVAIAYDGLEGLDYFKNHHVDIVLAEIKMPQMDGLHMLAKCHAINPDFVSIIITGRDDREETLRALKAGVFGYLTEPIAIEELIIAVSKGIELLMLRRSLAARKRELKQERALKKLELHLQQQIINTMLELALDAICIVDRDFKIIQVNEKFAKICGVSKEDAVGKKCYEVSGCMLGYTKRCPLIQLHNGHTYYREEYEIKHADGSKVPCLVVAKPYKSIDDELIGAMLYFRDITEVKKTEEALQTSRIYFYSIVEKSADGIIIVDREGITRFVNRAFKSMFGRETEGLIGEMFGLPIVTGKSTEVDIIRGDGKIGVGEMKSVETYWMGKSAYLIAIRDVTERKQFEEKIRAALREKKALINDLNDYVHFVSHDIRAPLRHIKALSIFINDDYSDMLDDNGKEYIRKIGVTCDNAETMINELLKLAKIRDTGIAQEEVNMNDIIREVETELEFFLKQNNGRIEVVDDLPTIPAHRQWLKDLFINLITNGITYNNSEDKLLRIGFEDKERAYVFYVADNGMGIGDNDKDEIFKPFKRAHSDKKGTGLGLTICMKVVEAHGGKIWVESETGKGSRFFFSIPR